MGNLIKTQAYTDLMPAEEKTCSICGNSCNCKFKQGHVCEDCLEYVTKKINLDEKASKPVSYP